MGNRQFSNGATSLLAANLSTSGTTVQVATGQGALFPGLTGSEYFTVTVQDTAGNTEYMKCTAISGDNLTVTRAQEGSTALSFTADLARVELRDTAATMANFYQKDGDTLTGPLNGGNQTATNLTLGSNVSIENANEIVNTPIRGATGVTTNQILVPADGSPATMGGGAILTANSALPVFKVGMVMMWNSALGNVPAGWQAADGTNGTPDLRNVFVVGAGSTYALGATGGSAATATGSAGAVAAGNTGSTALTIAQMPSHSHEFWAAYGNHPSGSGEHYADVYGGAYASTLSQGPNAGQQIIQNTGGGDGHTHTTAAVAAHTHSVTLPPYHALYFIAYVG